MPNNSLFTYEYTPGQFWVRCKFLKGLAGVCISNHTKKFSEKYGYKKYYRLPFGYRLTTLDPISEN